jgi:transposase InsO family protein
MPWKERTAVEERKAFLIAWERREQSFSSLCRYFGVSRPTGYKWLERFEAEGEPGLADQSRAPLHQPKAMADASRSRILELRTQHPTWGPKKLKKSLETRHPDMTWPARSTIGDLLRREGLARPRPARRRTLPHDEPLLHAQGPNDVWCADFKGWFLCANGQRCDPLTITDAYSRYLLRCRAVPKTDGDHVREIFTAAFREFGLPGAIRTDNGPPFASTGLCGLSRLSVWWIRLGIQPERIEPGCPEQNGRHERFHQTLKNETATPPAISLAAQKRRFADFQNEYNHLRPHEALGLRTPDRFYRPSVRPFPDRLPELVYPFSCNLRSVSAAGHISWINRQIHISVLLENQLVALRQVEEGFFEIFFGPLLLGWMDEPSATFWPVKPRPRSARRKRNAGALPPHPRDLTLAARV